jgi:hypothetical protein
MDMVRVLAVGCGLGIADALHCLLLAGSGYQMGWSVGENCCYIFHCSQSSFSLEIVFCWKLTLNRSPLRT